MLIAVATTVCAAMVTLIWLLGPNKVTPYKASPYERMVDTSQLGGLATATSQLGAALKANVASLGSVITATRNAAKGFSVSSPRYYYDLGDICKELETRTAIPAVTAASAAVRQAIGDAVVYEKHNTASAGATGISIDFSPASVYNPSSSGTYGLLRFARDTQWDEWLGIAP